MRVVTGSAKGIPLTAPPGEEVRPTSDRAKEGIFSAIQFEVEGARVLDLFCGSGQLGIEALSRGAHWAVFVDAAPASIEASRRNLAATGLKDKARVKMQDAAAYLSGCKEQFDIAFLDPPYDALKQGHRVLERLIPYMSPGGVIFYETARDAPVPERINNFTLWRRYHYGKSSVAAYRGEGEGL